LGPIDPHSPCSPLRDPGRLPHRAIVDQFEMAKQECRDPQNIGAWIPLLRSLAPGPLAQCRHQREMAEEFAERNLAQYMFAGRQDPKAKAKVAAKWFADFSAFKSHGRRVSRTEAQRQGLDVKRLEDDDELQDLVLSVHHAVRHTFVQTGVTKLIENHHGRAYIETTQQTVVQLLPPKPGQAPPGQPQNPSGNRAAGRGQQGTKRRGR
jgi:hypothetical protein